MIQPEIQQKKEALHGFRNWASLIVAISKADWVFKICGYYKIGWIIKYAQTSFSKLSIYLSIYLCVCGGGTYKILE